MRTFRAVIACLLATCAMPASALYLNPDGKGQGLVFPYYTVRAARGNPFNTFLSIVNHTADTKAIRVRFREGRNAREVAGFNLFLSPNNMWTGALVASDAGGTRLISTDLSCTSPAFAGSGPGLDFSGAAYQGDGFGNELDRTKEGWVEMIEMATLTGASAAAMAPTGQSGVPANCAAVQGSPTLNLAAPKGGISGTLTLINVANGQDFTVNAEALAELSRSSFFRPASDSYPDFNASEIDPVSVVVADGFVYRSDWGRAADAVSAVIMRSTWQAEYILDQGTDSRTEFVATFPTRHHYVSGSSAIPPFTAQCQRGYAGEAVSPNAYSREGRSVLFVVLPPEESNLAPYYQCGPSGVFDVIRPEVTLRAATDLLGSVNRPVYDVSFYRPDASNGWFGFDTTSGASLVSLSTSTRTSVASGVSTTGSHKYRGLPILGFSLRSFQNGTLSCASGTCQGNYGGAFPFKFSRSITPLN